MVPPIIVALGRSFAALSFVYYSGKCQFWGDFIEIKMFKKAWKIRCLIDFFDNVCYNYMDRPCLGSFLEENSDLWWQ